MALAKSIAKTAAVVVLVLVALHYVAPAQLKAYTGTV